MKTVSNFRCQVASDSKIATTFEAAVKSVEFPIPIQQGQFSWFSDSDGDVIGLMKTSNATTSV
jgi:hypothetical protein